MHDPVFRTVLPAEVMWSALLPSPVKPGRHDWVVGSSPTRVGCPASYAPCCRRTISVIRMGANGEVHFGGVG